jgi:RimJ/RimL family protein N-acetyltransferase
MPSPPRLVTERLRLRPLGDADAAPMTPLANDLGVARMTTSIPHPFTKDMAEGFVARMAQREPRREATFAIERRDGPFMGVLGVHPRDGSARELGYWIGRPFWGAGYMTEAVTAALVWASDEWGVRALAAGHFDDNAASGRVLTKAGFLYTGEVVNRFSVARGETAKTRMAIWLT